ncbi:hypothetical protein MSAN_00445100 [Mycena sanguinolenta]|uniref:Uncharacterized protein n=1 Tax=Mycena sanguinolenta TaxID=230812 RepID=A0A8H6ZDM9_9AGAR|nr:hypothetical protein MSAN_00445100 [Mycena sanguinolenta]
MDYTIDPSTLAEYWAFAVSRFYGICTDVLLYGVLLVLLCIAAPGLYYWPGGARKMLAAATFAMALLATSQVILHVVLTRLDLEIVRLEIEGETWPASPVRVRIGNLADRLYAGQDFLLVTNNIVTDSLFIYRCFLIWGRNARVVSLPILMLIASTVLGYVSTYQDDLEDSHFIDARIVYIMVLLTNIVLLTLTAGRIWWIRRDAILVLESAHVHKYGTIVAIILESGAIYCLTIIFFLISVSVSTVDSTIAQISQSAVRQIINIAPTLIIVRVCLRHNAGGTIPGPRLPQDRPIAPAGSRDGGNEPSFVINIGAECSVGTVTSMSDFGRDV